MEQDVRVIRAVNEARDFFGIKEFPGNFFSVILANEKIENKIIVFKEDIGNLSGFIGYGENDLAVICINYKRIIGHQNCTLAHEIGHWFMHKGENASDSKSIIDAPGASKSLDSQEVEANWFAREFLYPERFLVEDYHVAIEKELFREDNRKLLGEFIDQLCEKYCLSYEMVLKRILYMRKELKKYGKYRAEIENAIGGKISVIFNRERYSVDNNSQYYQRLENPYNDLAKKVEYLENKKLISKATADSIRCRNGV